MLCDMHCNMMQVEGNTFTKQRKRRAQMCPGLKSLKGLRVQRSCAPFYSAHGSRAARMDDYFEIERSLSSSTAVPLSLLGWYGAGVS